MNMSIPGASGVMPYQFEGNSIRIVEKDDEFWFVATDVARELGYRMASDMTRYLDADERGTCTERTPSGEQEMSTISEPGLYRAIIQRRVNKTADHAVVERVNRFQRWVFHDVLPSIRKTGGYGNLNRINVRDPSQLATIAIQLIEVNRELEHRAITAEAKVEEQAADVAVLDRIAKTNGALTLTDAAKTIGVPPQKFFKWVDTHEWTYRRVGNPERVAYQAKIKAGYLDHKMRTINRPDGTEKSVSSVVVLPAGVARLAKEFQATASLFD